VRGRIIVSASEGRTFSGTTRPTWDSSSLPSARSSGINTRSKHQTLQSLDSLLCSVPAATFIQCPALISFLSHQWTLDGREDPLADPDPDPWSASQYAVEDDNWDDTSPTASRAKLLAWFSFAYTPCPCSWFLASRFPSKTDPQSKKNSPWCLVY